MFLHQTQVPEKKTIPMSVQLIWRISNSLKKKKKIPAIPSATKLQHNFPVPGSGPCSGKIQNKIYCVFQSMRLQNFIWMSGDGDEDGKCDADHVTY